MVCIRVGDRLNQRVRLLIQEFLFKLHPLCLLKLQGVNTTMHQILVVNNLAILVKEDRFSILSKRIDEEALRLICEHEDQSRVEERGWARKVVLLLREILIGTSS